MSKNTTNTESRCIVIGIKWQTTTMGRLTTVSFSPDSIARNTPHPELAGEMIVLDQSPTSMNGAGSALILRATAYGIVQAHSWLSDPDSGNRQHRFVLDPDKRVIRATLPLLDADGSITSLTDEPRTFSYTARRLVLEQGLHVDHRTCPPDLLDTTRSGMLLAFRGEGIDPLLANLRQSEHPLSSHAAVVIEAATQVFRKQ